MRDHTSSEEQRPEERPRKNTRPSAQRAPRVQRAPRKAAGARDRTSYRVCCWGPAGAQVFDLYRDAVTLTWVLDVAHDERPARRLLARTVQ
jgi:hypothetical protein